MVVRPPPAGDVRDLAAPPVRVEGMEGAQRAGRVDDKDCSQALKSVSKNGPTVLRPDTETKVSRSLFFGERPDRRPDAPASARCTGEPDDRGSPRRFGGPIRPGNFKAVEVTRGQGTAMSLPAPGGISTYGGILGLLCRSQFSSTQRQVAEAVVERPRASIPVRSERVESIVGGVLADPLTDDLVDDSNTIHEAQIRRTTRGLRSRRRARWACRADKYRESPVHRANVLTWMYDFTATPPPWEDAGPFLAGSQSAERS